jgi:hypothetical protein
MEHINENFSQHKFSIHLIMNIENNEKLSELYNDDNVVILNTDYV